MSMTHVQDDAAQHAQHAGMLLDTCALLSSSMQRTSAKMARKRQRNVERGADQGAAAGVPDQRATRAQDAASAPQDADQMEVEDAGEDQAPEIMAAAPPDEPNRRQNMAELARR